MHDDDGPIIVPVIITLLFLASIVGLLLALGGCRPSSGRVTDARHVVGSHNGQRLDRWQLQVRDRWITVDAATYNRCPPGAWYPACRDGGPR